MMLVSAKTCLTLLWGTSLLFTMESMSASIPETSSIKSTAEPDKTTEQVISVHKLPTATHKPADISVAPAETTVPPTAIVTDRSDSSNDGTSGSVAMNTVATTTNSSGPRSLLTSTAVTAAEGAAHPSHTTTVIETAKPTDDQIHRHSPTTSTDTAAPATPSATSLTTVAVSSPQPTSTAKPEVTSELSSATSPSNSTQAPVFIQTISSPSASTTTITTANPTSEAAHVFDLTISETFTTSTELSSSSPVTRTPISTSQFPDTAGSTTEAPSISFSTHSPISTANVSTANVSTSPAAILNPHVPESLPVLTTKSTPTTTTAPCEASKSPPSTEVQPCSSRGVVRHCLIAVASLGALATVFMVSTIILCTKLSTRKYKVKKPQPATEMMCISSLLPERNYTYSRQRNPVSNGVLVIHGGADSDEDGGDNLTLSSFLPDNDRYV